MTYALPASADSDATRVLAKVPTLTVLFWVTKLLSTGMGEALADWSGEAFPIEFGVIGGLGFIGALVWQFRQTEYRAVPYWTAVSMVAVMGTVAADGLRLGLGLNLPEVTGLYLLLLGTVLTYWFRSEGTLSIHSITTRRRESLYWITVMLSFALGTAAGDLTAFYFNWGFGVSIIVFGVAILVPLALYRSRLLGEVAAFWTAYVLTRPLGASVADWMGKKSGLDWGDGRVAGVAVALIVALVAYLAITKQDVQHGVPEEVLAA